MTLSELKQIISQGETSLVQFKERITDAYKVGTELVAFSNSKGGVLIIGVDDKSGKINGLSFDELQFANNLLINAASENVKPSIVLLTETVATEEGNVLTVRIKEGVDKPYKDNKGIIWIKNGSDKRKVFANSELASIMQSCGALAADTRVVNECNLKDLDATRLKNYLMERFPNKFLSFGFNEKEDMTLEEAVSNVIPHITVEQLLKNLKFINNEGKVTLGALLLFGKHPRRFNSLLTVLCISFVGNSVASNSFRDQELQIDGCLAEQYEKVVTFIKRNLRNIQVEKGFNSLPELEIPEVVFVELLVNALIHRDYFQSAAIRLFIFDDRIEIHSPGNLPSMMSEEDLKKGISKPRNMMLFDNARYAGLPYTGVGSGIIRALSAYHDIKMEDKRGIEEFVITIKRPDIVYDIDCIDNKEVTMGVDIANDIVGTISENQKNVLLICLSPQNSRDILKLINVVYHPDSLKLYIRDLVEMGYLQLTIPEKPTSPKQLYYTTEKGKQLLRKK
jgi:predicted HTH transcriptional regulator